MRKINVVILFSGNGSNMENIIQTLHAQSFIDSSQEDVAINVACCITNNPDAYGILRCKRLGIQCRILSHKNFKNRGDFDTALVDLIQSYEPDLSVLAGFMRILTPVFTSKIKCINIHPSLLPKFKGKDAIKESFHSSDEIAGVTVHWVDEVLDSGEIILQDCIPKISGESLESFQERIHHLEYSLYPRAILQALNLKGAIKNA